MNKLQIDRKITSQIRVDSELVHLLKIKAAKQRTTIRGLVEGALAEVLRADDEQQN